MKFAKPGKENTEETIELALTTARQRGIKNIVVASSTGFTMNYFTNIDDLNIVCVTHSYGFPEAGKNDMPKDTRKELEDSFQVLSPREKEYIDIIYGLNGKEQKTITELANELSITKQIISSIHVRALKKLNSKRKNTAIVGDQIFTDIIGGNFVGVKTIWLTPIEPEPMLSFRIRRKLEAFLTKLLKIKNTEV